MSETIDLPVPLDTARLRLRPPQVGDGAALHEAIVETLIELRRFLASRPWVATEQSIDGSEAFCRDAAANFAARKDLSFLAFEKDGGSLVGVCGLHRIDWDTPKVEVGYWCRTSKTRQGFITEAVEALVEFAVSMLGVVRVELITDEENVASRRVAERCGFVLEGTLRHERRGTDRSLRNTCIYARFPQAPAVRPDGAPVRRQAPAPA